jgi:putative MATE family efflux protein
LTEGFRKLGVLVLYFLGDIVAKKDINMTEGPILSRMIMYTLPLLLSGVLQTLYNAADVAVVGNFAEDSERSLAAVGSTGSLTNLIVGLFLGLSVGTCVVLSQHLGAKQDKDSSEVVHTAMLSSVFIGLVLAVIGIALSKPLLLMMATPENVIDLSSLYMRIYFLGLPVSMLYNFGAAILRAKGDTNYPLIVLIISGLVNVLLNLLLVIVFRLDVAGVAIATVASQLVSAIMVTVHLCRLDDSCKLFLKRLKIYPDKLKSIIAVGLPAGFQSVIFSISNVLLQSSINSLGKVAMAGNTAATNVDGFIYIAQNSVYHAAMAFAGQNVGAGNMKRVKKTAIASAFLVTVIGLIIGSIAFFFADPLLSIYAPGEKNLLVREQGLFRLQAVALLYFLCGLMEVFTGLMRGMGNSVMPMIISMLGACGVRIFWIFVIFPIERFHNMFGLFLSYPISWFLTALAQFVAYIIVYKRSKRRLELIE